MSTLYGRLVIREKNFNKLLADINAINRTRQNTALRILSSSGVEAVSYAAAGVLFSIEEDDLASVLDRVRLMAQQRDLSEAKLESGWLKKNSSLAVLLESLLALHGAEA